MRIYALTGGGLVLAAFFLSAMPASAQQNPFVPPSSGGLSKAQVQAIIRAEVARQAASGGGGAAPSADGSVTSQMKGGGKPPLPGSGAAAVVGSLPTQGGGAPTGVSTAAGGRAGGASDPNDVISQLISDGGQFVGCVSATPVFKDKDGRRAYFTSKELKASNAAKRIARCG